MFQSISKIFVDVGKGNFDFPAIISLSLFVLIVFGLIFLIIREWVCWYTKINERILLQERTNELLEAVLDKMNGKNIPREEVAIQRSNGKNSIKKESDAEIPETVVMDRGNKIITINL